MLKDVKWDALEQHWAEEQEEEYNRIKEHDKQAWMK